MLPIVEAWPATSRCAPRCANHSSKHLDSPVAICYTHSMSTTMPMRVDGDLFEAAKSVGAVASRSAAQQISHWARIGRELEASPGTSPRDVQRVLAGEAGYKYDNLGERDQAVVRASWDEQLDER